MSPPHSTRRKILQAAGSAIGFTLAGCTSRGASNNEEPTQSEPSPTPQPTPTETPSASPSSSQFAFAGTMVHQLSGTSPPQFRVTFTNEGQQAVKLRYGAGLLWSPGTEHPEGFQLVPSKQEIEHLSTTPPDRCWEHPDPVPIPAVATVHSRFAPGERVSQLFAIYNETENGCYPAGEYSVRDEIEIDGTSIELAARIRIDEAQTFSITTIPSEISV